MKSAHSSTRCALWLTALVIAFSTYSANAREPAEAQALPEWFTTAMAQEKSKLKSTKVSVGDGFFTSQMAGKRMGKPQPLDGGWYMQSNIGTASPLECWVFESTVDPATLAANVAKAGMQSAEQANGKLDNLQLHSVDAGAYDNAPYLALEWLYTVGEPPNALAGLAKVRVAVLPGATLACGHNMMGFRETFANAFETMVRQAKVSTEPTHYYEEVLVQKIGGQPVGFAHTTFTLDEDGDTNILMLESMLIPVDGATLTTSDTWHSAFSRTDGSLINQVTATSENGELTTQLALEPMGDGTWAVSGVFQGKEVYEEIPGNAQPMSEIGQMHAVQHLLADDEAGDVTMTVWVPTADPTRFLEAGVSMPAEGRDEGYGTLTLGPLAIAAQFDQSGSLLTGRMDAGPADMVMERVWADGTPP
jgi:hypothetical protein